MKIEFYHIDAFEVPNYEPIWRQLKYMGVDARMVGVPGNLNTAENGWFDFERFKAYCIEREIPYSTEADPTADIAITTQNENILRNYTGKHVRLMYGLTAYPASWGLQQHAVKPFDAVLTHGNVYAKIFSAWLRHDQLPVIGYPRYDDFFSGKLSRDLIHARWDVNNNKPVLVFLPSWDINTAFDTFFPALMRLTHKYHIVLRPHHCTVRLEPKRMALLNASGLLILDNAFDLAEIYTGADVVLADVRSGSMLEACLLDVPTVGMVFDPAERSGWVQAQGLDKILTLCDNPAQLEMAIETALSQKNKPNENRNVWTEQFIAFRDGTAAKQAANALLSMVDQKPVALKKASSVEKLVTNLANQLEDLEDHPEVWQNIESLQSIDDNKILQHLQLYLSELTRIPQEPLSLLLLQILEAVCLAYVNQPELAKSKLSNIINQHPNLYVAIGALSYISKSNKESKNKSLSIAGVILGSGKGTRYGSAVPKQYIKINGKPCIKYVIDTFLKSKIFSKIIVVIDDLSYQYLLKEYANKIEIIQGGVTRNKSVNNAVQILKSSNPDYVFFHDAARPMLTVSDIFKFVDNIDADSAGLIAVRKIEDSLYEIGEDRLNRDNYRLVQTPELFNFKKFSEHFHAESEYTALYEQLPMNMKIKMIYLNHLNYKITSPYDIYMLEHLLKYCPYKPTTPYLQGKTALVLGGTGGIGSAVVRKLRESGATVIAPTRQELDLANFSYHFKTDFDIIINAAGAYHNDAEGVLENYDEVMNVNLKANLHIIEYVKTLVNRPIRVVFISSSSSSKGRENLIVYSASKAALHSVVESMSRKLSEEGIFVNVICPEKVRTPLLNKLHEGNFEENELLEPDEVAEAILSYTDTQEFGNIIHLKKGFKLATPKQTSIEEQSL